MKNDVTVFSAYPFKIGQKIRIDDTRRRGDWEVVGFDNNKVTLRCPISGKEFSWARFCYFTKEEECRWPQSESD